METVKCPICEEYFTTNTFVTDSTLVCPSCLPGDIVSRIINHGYRANKIRTCHMQGLITDREKD